MKRFFSAAWVCIVLCVTPIALAWDGVVTGKIRAIEVTNGSNYAFRIWFTTDQAMCSAGSKFAFLNEADSNYKIYVSALLMAKAQGSTIVIHTTNDGAYCRIGHLIVTD